MQIRSIPTFVLIAYSVMLIRTLVFKIADIRIGGLMFNFSSTEMGEPNFIPFKTILPYLRGDHGLVIGGFNLVGNVALLVPVGFLVPFLYREMTSRKSLVLALGVGLALEGAQVAIRRGVFDVDDIILNGFGVLIGYWLFTGLAKLMRPSSALADSKS